MVPGDPFVARLPAHPIAVAQLGHAEVPPQGVQDELGSLLHTIGLTPWHRAPPFRWCPSLHGVLPMCPVYTIRRASSPASFRLSTRQAVEISSSRRASFS